MLHRIPLEQLGAHGPGMAEAIEACVHCGFCLTACPTYQLLGQELDSPRGRIYLMKAALEGELDMAGSWSEHLDRCLGCLACVTACPSGVQYGELLTPFRALQERKAPSSRTDRFIRQSLVRSLTDPDRFRRAHRLGSFARRFPFARRLPARLRGALDLLPDRLPEPDPLPEFVPAIGERRARVALLAGCVQQALDPAINRATVRVLAHNGVEVWIPRSQGCCGALALHAGEEETALRQARDNLKVFHGLDVDAVLVTAAGCGSAMKEYDQLFSGRPEESEARSLAGKVQDITEFLVELGPLPPGELPEPLRVAYHDACHLAHAQGIRGEPRRLLASIPNLELVELAESDMCCGSAGIYNLEQPELAGQLQERKAGHVLDSRADAVVTGNIGCMVQIGAGIRRKGGALPVYHTIQLLALAYTSLDGGR